MSEATERAEGGDQRSEDNSGARVDMLRAAIDRMHAERGPLVAAARDTRMAMGISSPEFAAAWFEVERVTRDLVEAEAALERALEADASLPHPERERAARGGAEGAEKNPMQRAVIAVMDLFNVIDSLPDSEAVKVVEFIKCRARVSMLNTAARKAVAHG